MKHTMLAVLFCIAIGAAGSSIAAEARIDDRAALADLKVGKGVFLIDIGDPKKLNFYLEVIEGTHRGMEAQGVEPDFVLVYIGPSVKYLTKNPTPEAREDAGSTLITIESNIERLATLGVRQEICAVATKVFSVDNDSVMSGLTPVADGFVSLIGYQAQGYHLVPVF